MPISTGMNEKSNRYAMKALKNKRASIASEIVQAQRHMRHLQDALGHVDATIRLLDPSVDTGSIPNKRIVRRVRLFRQGELGRSIIDALRRADQPCTIHEIVTAILIAGGHEETARGTIRQRIGANLTYLRKTGKVVRVGSNHGARWRLG